MNRPSTAIAVLVVGALWASACSITTKEEAEEAESDEAAQVETESALPEEGVDDGSDLHAANMELVLASQYSQPITMIRSRSGSHTIFIGDPGGRIYEIERDAKRNLEAGFTSFTWRPQTRPWLDISRQVRHLEDGVGASVDQGFHGFDFSTDGSRLYVSFTNNEGQVVVSEFRVGVSQVSPTSQRELLVVNQTHADHNGGPVMVGSDGFLHIALGDGGQGDSYALTSQDPLDWRGSVLRIDPEAGASNTYTIPFGNPYNGDDGAREVYLNGLRNPSFMTYDPDSRTTFVGDHGAEGLQEITTLTWDGNEPPVTGNLGWPLYNGTQTYDADDDETLPNNRPPILEYPRTTQTCSVDGGVVGGVVYNGDAHPALRGAFLYGDFCNGHIFALTIEDGEITGGAKLPIQVEPESLGAIGTDPSGELLVTTIGGTIYQVNFLPPIDPAVTL